MEKREFFSPLYLIFLTNIKNIVEYKKASVPNSH